MLIMKKKFQQLKNELTKLVKQKPRRYSKNFCLKNADIYIEKDSETSWQGYVYKRYDVLDVMGNMISMRVQTNHIYGYATALRAFLVLRRIAKVK